MRFRYAPTAWIVILSLGLAACGPNAAHFSTELGAPDGLSKGDPVNYGGTRIGQVTSVNPLSYGSSEVGFDVEQPHADLVHQDSIMVLHSGVETPSLELRNPNAGSPIAASDSRLTGASSEAEARGILLARGLGSYATGLAQMLLALGSGPGSGANPALVAPLIQQLLQIQQSAVLNSYVNSPASQQQVHDVMRQLEAVRRELERQGKTAQAQQLRNEIERLLRAAAPPSAPAAPNTLITPRVYP